MRRMLPTILTRGSLREFTRAMRTPRRLDRNCHRTGWAVLRNWRGGGRRPFLLVSRFNHQKNTEGNDDEIDHESDEISVVPSDRPRLGGIGGSMKGTPTGGVP